MPGQTSLKSVVAISRGILQGVNRILQEALVCATEEELGKVCLEVAEELTKSKFGFIGLIDSRGLLYDIAISDPGWNACRMDDQTGHVVLPNGLKIRGIYGRVLRDGKGFFTNSPATHPDRIGLPPGHPPLTAFLGTPLRDDKKIIGMVALANRDGGYRNDDLFTLNALAVAMAQAIKRKQMEEDLLAAHREMERDRKFLDAVFQSLPVGICITDEKGGILRTNHMSEEIWGGMPATTGVEEYHVYKAWWANTQTAVQPEEWASARAVQKGEVVAGQVLEIEGFDGRHRVVSNSAAPVFDDSGRIIGSAVSIQDVTRLWEYSKQLKEAKAMAEQASHAKSDFLSTMSHEIRTPMTIISSAIEHLMLIDKLPEHQTLLKLADQANQHLISLVNDILDFSKIEAGRMDVDRELFDLRDCLGRNLSMMTVKARERGLSLDLEVSPAVPKEMVGDQHRLGQILINLIGNAIKFTENGGVTVAVQLRGDTLEFGVSDTGIGIPEDKLGTIFETFSQADNSSTRRHSGTGLGLAISRKLVELMGGRMSVSSQLGKGSQFLFTLPVKNLAIQESASSGEIQSLPATAVPEVHILLVEDNPMIREIIQMTLSHHPWRVTTAETGQDGVRLWQEGNVDLVLMDLQMPGMGGLEATREIRRREAGVMKRVGIIGLTANASCAVRKECLDAGMNEVLVKPFPTVKLQESIERYLADRQLHP